MWEKHASTNRWHYEHELSTQMKIIKSEQYKWLWKIFLKEKGFEGRSENFKWERGKEV